MNQPMRVQIASLQHTVIISLSEQHIKSILIGWEETNGLCLSFNKISWRQPQKNYSYSSFTLSLFLLKTKRTIQLWLFVVPSMVLIFLVSQQFLPCGEQVNKSIFLIIIYLILICFQFVQCDHLLARLSTV